MKSSALRGRSVLIVEDDFNIALDLQYSLEDAGATVVGPVGRLDDALGLVWDITDIDIAVLDVDLHGQRVFPVAEALRERGIPFVFATAFERNLLPEAYAQTPLCTKPMEYELLSATVVAELNRRPFGRSH